MTTYLDFAYNVMSAYVQSAVFRAVFYPLVGLAVLISIIVIIKEIICIH